MTIDTKTEKRVERTIIGGIAVLVTLAVAGPNVQKANGNTDQYSQNAQSSMDHARNVMNNGFMMTRVYDPFWKKIGVDPRTLHESVRYGIHPQITIGKDNVTYTLEYQGKQADVSLSKKDITKYLSQGI